jgi:hypothetical protein
MRHEHEVYKAAWELSSHLEGAEWDITGREKLVFTIVNPYGPMDERPDTVSVKVHEIHGKNHELCQWNPLALFMKSTKIK